MADITESFEATEYSREGKSRRQEMVIREMPLTIHVNGEELVTLLCTPERMGDLAIGFLWSEGVVDGKADVKKVVVDEEKGAVWIEVKRDTEFIKNLMFKRLITSGCGKGTTFYSAVDQLATFKVTSDLTVSPQQVLDMMAEFQRTSELYKATHGVHSAALATPEKLEVFREDIGRHNAIDKILGECLMKGIRLTDKLMVTTGRVSSEVLLKVAKRGVPVLISRTSPTDLAVRLADQLGVTLIGFVRGGKMRVYVHEERIASEK